MAPTPSFAPVAARLAARADEIRSVDGAEVSWANFMALFFCAIFQMLILLCEALDARGAADARPLTAPASHDGMAGVVPAVRAGCRALPGAVRRPQLALAPEVQAMVPQRDDARSGTTEPKPDDPGLTWPSHPSPDWAVPDHPWQSRRETKAFQVKVQRAYIITIS